MACVLWSSDLREGCALGIMVDYTGQTSLRQDCSCSNRSQQILSDMLGPFAFGSVCFEGKQWKWHTQTDLPCWRTHLQYVFRMTLVASSGNQSLLAVWTMCFRRVLFMSATVCLFLLDQLCIWKWSTCLSVWAFIYSTDKCTGVMFWLFLSYLKGENLEYFC